MVALGLLIIETMAAIQTVFRVSQQYALMLDTNVSRIIPAEDMPRMESLSEQKHHYTSIHHYARHGLCRNFEGQKNLYRASKTKLCNTKLSFTADFVIELCRRKGQFLDKWVAELFDLDGDGYITHHEKNYYNYAR